jgi:hypothetical protein
MSVIKAFGSTKVLSEFNPFYTANFTANRSSHQSSVSISYCSTVQASVDSAIMSTNCATNSLSDSSPERATNLLPKWTAIQSTFIETIYSTKLSAFL